MTADKPVITALNAALEVEWTACEAYLCQARTLEVWGLAKLADKWREEVEEERTHAKRLVDRLIFLEGQPTTSRIDRPAPPGSPRQVADLLAADLEVELEGLDRYRAGIATCREHGDETTAGILAENLDETEGHILMLESLMASLEAVGVQNFLASWL